jgi:hypothetical protein
MHHRLSRVEAVMRTEGLQNVAPKNVDGWKGYNSHHPSSFPASYIGRTEPQIEWACGLAQWGEEKQVALVFKFGKGRIHLHDGTGFGPEQSKELKFRPNIKSTQALGWRACMPYPMGSEKNMRENCFGRVIDR